MQYHVEWSNSHLALRAEMGDMIGTGTVMHPKSGDPVID